MKNQVVRHDKLCRLCKSDRVTTVLKLKDTPLEDRFVKQSDLGEPQPVYPLELAICENCGYVHLPYVVSPEASYSDYIYVSGVTVGLRDHYDRYAEELVADYQIAEGSLVVDLGSNDGSMLSSFKRLGMRVLGIEPSSAIADQANKLELTTINDFFTEKVASRILQDYGSVDIVTANYMYANVDDVINFTKNVARLLKQDGIFVVQTGYHPEQMKLKMFDYIYHEHFSYFTVEVLRNIFSLCGLELIHVVKTSPKGGSLRATGQLRGGSRSVHESVEALVHEERVGGMRQVETYQQFAIEVESSKQQMLELLTQLKKLDKRVVGFGASHSTTTLLYHFELAPFLDYLIDDNELKHGLYSPGYHLLVYPPSKMYEDMPDYVLILAWQHKQSILEKHRSFLSSSNVVVPLPQLEVL